ncbi:MAG: putative DNA replication licensing factor MCM5, partial [Streblomastix strix]
MDWAHQHVQPGPVAAPFIPQGDDNEARIGAFEAFFEGFAGPDGTAPYKQALSSQRRRGDYWIDVNINHLRTFNQELAIQLTEVSPSLYLKYFNEAACRAAEITRDEPRFQVILKSDAPPQSIRSLQEARVGTLVKVRGIVLSSSRTQSRIIRATIQCRNCQNIMQMDLDAPSGYSDTAISGKLTLPRTCTGLMGNVQVQAGGGAGQNRCPLDPFVLMPEQCLFADSQLLKMQEAYEDVPTGDIPRHIRIILERTLVNRAKPGANLIIYGILLSANA